MDAATAIHDLTLYLDRDDPFVRTRLEAIEAEFAAASTEYVSLRIITLEE